MLKFDFARLTLFHEALQAGSFAAAPGRPWRGIRGLDLEGLACCCTGICVHTKQMALATMAEVRTTSSRLFLPLQGEPEEGLLAALRGPEAVDRYCAHSL